MWIDGDRYQPELFDVWSLARGAERIGSGFCRPARSLASRLAGCSGTLQLSAGRGYFTDRCAVKPPYVLYKPGDPQCGVAARAGSELRSLWNLSRKRWTLIGTVLLSLGLWVLVEKSSTPLPWVCWPSLMLALRRNVVPWKDITRYNGARNTSVVNLATLVVMANGNPLRLY